MTDTMTWLDDNGIPITEGSYAMRCVHCALSPVRQDHEHEVIGVWHKMKTPTRAWFRDEALHYFTHETGARDGYQDWEYVINFDDDGKLICETMALTLNDGTKYIWRLTDEHNDLIHARLGVWVD